MTVSKRHGDASIATTLFMRDFPLDEDLIGLAREKDAALRHVINPASHNTYVYLVHFIEEMAGVHFADRVSGLRVIDWGCGAGHISYMLNRIGFRTVGCDPRTRREFERIRISDTLVDYRPLPHPYELPFGDDSADLLVSFGVLEHVPEPLESLKEIHRVVRPDGLFFCFYLPYFLSMTQAVQKLRGRWSHDVVYRRRGIQRALREAGFTVDMIWHRGLFPKLSIRYRDYRRAERWDQWLCRYTPLKFFATNIEFVAINT